MTAPASASVPCAPRFVPLALAFTTRENIARTRQGMAIRDWQFGGECVRTKVNVLVPRGVEKIDVTMEQIGLKTTDEYDVAVLLQGD